MPNELIFFKFRRGEYSRSFALVTSPLPFRSTTVPSPFPHRTGLKKQKLNNRYRDRDCEN